MREWVMSDCVGGGDERMVVWLVMITTVVSFDADAIVRSAIPWQRSARAMK